MQATDAEFREFNRNNPDVWPALTGVALMFRCHFPRERRWLRVSIHRLLQATAAAVSACIHPKYAGHYRRRLAAVFPDFDGWVVA
jgi:hypothetical protein